MTISPCGNFIVSDNTVRYYQYWNTEFVTGPNGHAVAKTTQRKTWVVTGPNGTISKHRNEEAASKACDEWQAFYDKHPFKVPISNAERERYKRKGLWPL